MEDNVVMAGEQDEPLPESVEKKRKSTGSLGGPTVPGCLGKECTREEHGHRKSGKKKKVGSNDIHAETQRLLRETSGAAFTPQPLMVKPVSSLIEKIRQRKLQLAHNATRIATSSLVGSFQASNLDLKKAWSEGKALLDAAGLDRGVELTISKPQNGPAQLAKQEFDMPSTSATHRSQFKENSLRVDEGENPLEDVSSRPSTPNIHSGSPTSDLAYRSLPKSFLHVSGLELQELYSYSQLGPQRDGSLFERTHEGMVPAMGTGLNLHLGSETQDDDRWTQEDDKKENEGPRCKLSPDFFPVVSHVRGLIDDEAEDDDDDPVEDEDEDEDIAEEFCDLVTEDAQEIQADIDHRAELHSRWLEQQDLIIEDDILHRIENGWKTKSKIPELLGEAEEIVFSGNNPRPCGGKDKVLESAYESSFKLLRDQVKDLCPVKSVTTSPAENQDWPTQDENSQESSDDEGIKRKIRHQLLLEESEEKTEFLSVADDESSKEIFSLINKVNVATFKSKTAIAQNEVRAYGTAHHLSSIQHQSSFLLRKVTTLAPMTRHGSGNSRSYVFGRDDSNSRDQNRSTEKREQMIDKENSFPLSSDEQKFNTTTSQTTGKSGSTRQKDPLGLGALPVGLSLFQVLKQQAADLASGKDRLTMNQKNSGVDDLSIFSASRPSRRSRDSEGT